MSFLPLYNIARIKDTKDLPKIAEVINNNDPKGLGRIKVKLDGMFDPSDKSGSNLPWIRKMRSEMGIGIDEKNIPMVGDKVEIIWPYDNKHAFYRGLPFGDSDKIMSSNAYNWGWTFNNGFKLLINKENNSFKIGTDTYYISLDTSGVLTIKAKKVVIDSTDKSDDKVGTVIDTYIFKKHKHTDGNEGKDTGEISDKSDTDKDD